MQVSTQTAGAVIVAHHAITSSKQYFSSYQKFAVPEIVSLGRRNATMQTYEKGVVNIQVYYYGK